MDQKKTGNFLKQLRKEKSLTQEQLAEMLNVSSRSVSRWETGCNMPELSILAELSAFYNVDMKEILNGETNNEVNTMVTFESFTHNGSREINEDSFGMAYHRGNYYADTVSARTRPFIRDIHAISFENIT